MANFFPKVKPAIVDQGNVFISNNTLVIGSTAYHVQNISSFGYVRMPNIWQNILIGSGIIIGIPSLPFLSHNPAPFIVALALVVCGFILPKKYGIRVESNSSSVMYITSKNTEFLNQISFGIYRAINSGYTAREMHIFNIDNANIKTGDIYNNIGEGNIFAHSTVNAK